MACIICRDSDECYSTPCGHLYCDYCLKKWLKKHHNCPTCNASIRHAYIDKFELDKKSYADIAVVSLIDVAKYLYQEVQKDEYQDSKKDVAINVGKILYDHYNNN